MIETHDPRRDCTRIVRESIDGCGFPEVLFNKNNNQDRKKYLNEIQSFSLYNLSKTKGNDR